MMQQHVLCSDREAGVKVGSGGRWQRRVDLSQMHTTFGLCGPVWASLQPITRLQSISILLAGSDPVCLVIGIRWVAAKARRPGFSGTHSNLEAFILWKRCLVKVQHCSPASLMTLQFFLPRPEDRAVWWIWLVKQGHTHTHAHTCFHHRAPWWIWLLKALNTVSWVLHFLPPRPRSAKAEPGFTKLGPDWIAD